MFRHIVRSFKLASASSFSSHSSKTTSFIATVFATRNRDIYFKKMTEQKLVEDLVQACEKGATEVKHAHDLLNKTREDISQQAYKNLIQDKMQASLQKHTEIFLDVISSAVTTNADSIYLPIKQWPDGGINPNFKMLDFFKPILAAHGITFELVYAVAKENDSYISGLKFNFSQKIKLLPVEAYSYYTEFPLPELRSWLWNFTNQLEKTLNSQKRHTPSF